MAAPAPRIALIELLDRDGRVRRVVDVQAWPLTIGRALDNHLVLDDPHVAEHHLSLGPDAQGLLSASAVQTLNGVGLGKRVLSAGQSMVLPAGPNLLQLGHSRLRLRRADDVLAAEQPVRAEASLAGTLACGVALLALWGAQHAIEMDPGAKLVDWIGLVLGVPVGLAVWCVGWGLASKLFQHRFEFWPHAAIAARGLLAAALAGIVLAQVAASFGWGWLSRAEDLVVPLIVATMVAAHASVVLPFRRRAVFGTVAALAVGSIAANIALNQHRFDRSFSELYMTTLPMPATRFAQGVSPQQFVQETAVLREPLQKRVHDARLEGEEAAADGDAEE